MLAYSGICWHIVTHMNVDISWLMNMLTPIGISVTLRIEVGGGGLEEGDYIITRNCNTIFNTLGTLMML